MKRAHVYVTGTVQGVWFRESARTQASQLNVTGWIRNLPDGRVEAVFEGTPFAVDALVAWCRLGPGRAKVRHVDVNESDVESAEAATFEVRR
ncbi:MAG: acylphosphatase [Thermoplasmatota archaeon]|nr:acylphosphatase [Halobacteriales archaeon]